MIGIILVLGASSVAQDHFPEFITDGSRNTNGQGTVSVNQLRVPAKARKASDKAVAAIQRNELDEAKRQISSALAAYPNYAAGLFLRGLVKVLEQDVVNGAADLQEAINKDPDYGPAYLTMGFVHNNAGRYHDALVLLRRGSQLLPLAWQSHHELSRALYGSNNYNEALLEITTALRLVPYSEGLQTLATLHYDRARVLLKLSDFASARSDLQTALQQDQCGQAGAFAQRALDRLQPENGQARASVQSANNK